MSSYSLVPVSFTPSAYVPFFNFECTWRIKDKVYRFENSFDIQHHKILAKILKEHYKHNSLNPKDYSRASLVFMKQDMNAWGIYSSSTLQKDIEEEVIKHFFGYIPYGILERVSIIYVNEVNARYRCELKAHDNSNFFS